ncbi:MAG: NACHT domain-containing NTPase [Halothece sp.]
MTGGFKSAASKQVFQSIWNKAKEFFEHSQKKSQFFSAAQKYYQHYQARHGIVKVLTMREPTNLDSIYTSVRVLDRVEIQQFESIEGLEEQYRARKERGLFPQKEDEQEKQRGIEIAQQKQYLTVLGQPGVGKSTFLKKMGLEALQGRYWQFEVKTQQGEKKVEERPCIPVLLELKRFDVNKSIKTAIVEELANCGFPEFEKPVEKWLNEGQLLVLFDGLDEVPSQSRDQVVTAIEDFVDRYPYNRYIASCRTAAYRSKFRRFTDVTVADFDDEQVKQFIYNWFNYEEDEQAETAKQFWQLLQKPEQASAKELARTPLLLTFLCLIYQRSQVIPPTRSSLYGKALNILLEEWATEKQVQRDEIYQGLHPDLEIELLAEIAYPNFKENRLFFHREDILETITEFLSDRLDAPKYLNAKAVLQAIEEQQGILVERDEGIYSFSHLTLQEYLTAYYIVTNQLEEEIVDEHLTDDRWQEVFLLVAGLMKGRVSQLLQKMAERTKDYLESDKLRELVKSADSATTGSSGNYKPATKRAVAILTLLSISIFHQGIPVSIGDSVNFAMYLGLPHNLRLLELPVKFPASYEFLREIEKLNIFSTFMFSNLIRKLEKRSETTLTPAIRNEIFNTFDLDPSIAELSREEDDALKKYIKANLLIVKCKEASVALSGKAWQPIEDNLLKLN